MELAITDDLGGIISRSVQTLVRSTPTILLGSGFSCTYGLPLMAELGEHLAQNIGPQLISDQAKDLWQNHLSEIKKNLEAGLDEIAAGANGRKEVIMLLRDLTAKFVIERMTNAEKKILTDKNRQDHAPSRLFRKIYVGAPENGPGISIITTNYDTLIELFCDLANLPIDTGFEGLCYRTLRTGSLFHNRYIATSATLKGRIHRLEKTVRVIKPHGSITWIATESGPMEVLNGTIRGTPEIVVPGPSKYEDALTNVMFDKMRTTMNQTLDQSQSLIAIGFGFNDRHLQGYIEERLKQGMPLLILAKHLTDAATVLVERYSNVIAICKAPSGALCHFDRDLKYEYPLPLWQLDNFLKFFLE